MLNWRPGKEATIMQQLYCSSEKSIADLGFQEHGV